MKKVQQFLQQGISPVWAIVIIVVIATLIATAFLVYGYFWVPELINDKSNTYPNINLQSLNCNKDLITSSGKENLIVKAKVIGDHEGDFSGWSIQKVKVLETLDGIDAVGDLLNVRAKGIYWEGNKEYMLLLENHGIGEKGETILIEAKDSNAEIRKGIQKCDKAILWMVYEDGWGRGIMNEFVLLENGQYEYKRVKLTEETYPNEFEIIKGATRMDEKSIKEIVQAVSSAERGSAAEDAGVVVFMWRDGSEKIYSKQYDLPYSSPSKELMDLIEKKAVWFNYSEAQRKEQVSY